MVELSDEKQIAVLAPARCGSAAIGDRPVERALVVANVRAEMLAVLETDGVTPEFWAKGMKRGIEQADPAVLRLHAQVVGLLDDDSDQRRIVDEVVNIVKQAACEFVAPERRADFFRFLADHIRIKRSR